MIWSGCQINRIVCRRTNDFWLIEMVGNEPKKTERMTKFISFHNEESMC